MQLNNQFCYALHLEARFKHPYMCVILHFLGEWLSSKTSKSIYIQNTIPSYFTILKSYSINYTIPFYNTSNLPKLYYFTILLKYYFLIVLGKHKKHFFIRPLSFFFIPSLSLSLSLSLLSGFDCAPVRASMRSWVMDREFVIWVHGFVLQL